jgi:hypothetical protein
MSKATTNFKNFDSSLFENYKSSGMNKLIDDECHQQAHANDNKKKLKFITTNHIDLLEAKDKLNFFGIGIKDQLFVPGEKIDTYSGLLNGIDGGILTNYRIRNGLGELPIQIGFKGQGFHGDPVIEDQIRNNIEVKKNACLPRDTDFEKRSFYLFENLESPNPLKAVEQPQLGFTMGRMGLATRFDNRYGKK